MNVDRPNPHSLGGLFAPRNVALVGASDRSSWSNSIYARFCEYGHDGQLFAVNRNGTPAHGLPGHTSVTAIGEVIDTAYIYVPNASVPDALCDAAAAGVRNAVILSSGFAEAGDEGVAKQARLLRIANELGMTILGPNSLGFANFTQKRFCTSVRSRLPVREGQLALVSQSGAVTSELAKWAHAQGIGLSFFCSTGNEAQIGIAEVVDYLVDHAQTKSIAIYAEGLTHPDRFMAAAHRAMLAEKPLTILKVGRSAVSAQVAQAHTGAMVGDDRVFEAVCERFGIARVSSIEELISTAEFLGRTGPIDPPRVALASISGGSCAMYADLAAIHGLAMPPLSEQTVTALRKVLPSFAATLNPLDVTGVAMQDPSIWTEALPILASDPAFGLVIAGHGISNTPQERGIQSASFAAIAKGFSRAGRPPVILSYSLQDMHEPQEILRRELNIERVLPSIDLGVKALAHLQRWSERLLDRRPQAAAACAGTAHPAGEREVLDHLACFGVPVVPAVLATTSDAAVSAARRFGGPVAVKIASRDIAHKTEVAGVRLNVQGDEAVEAAYQDILSSAAELASHARVDGVLVSPMRTGGVELIVGIARDPQWGPVLLLGLGGLLAEAMQDSRICLLPAPPEHVRAMLEGLRGARILQGFRGLAAADMNRLVAVIVAIGEAALALAPELQALEVNPLRVDGADIECLDGLALYAG